jgi:hypothetical protein
MTEMDRRTALGLVASAPLAAALVWTDAEADEAHRHAQQARRDAVRRGTAFKPKFFTPHEYVTVAVLVDLIIPKDARSGSATDAGVPEFMDFMMIDQPRRQAAMRGGFALIDHVCEERFDKRFVDCTDDQRRQVLDEIAFPAKTKPELSQAVAFFSSFRDLTATGFWTSKIGIADLQYIGNTFVPEWKGCPPEALKKLGL